MRIVFSDELPAVQALGEARFRRQIAKALDRRVAPFPRRDPPGRRRNGVNQICSDPSGELV
jgi:hypothetical protein